MLPEALQIFTILMRDSLVQDILYLRQRRRYSQPWRIRDRTIKPLPHFITHRCEVIAIQEIWAFVIDQTPA